MRDLHALSLRVQGGRLEVLDQRLLPDLELWLPVQETEQLVTLVRALALRGAPLIGVAAAVQLGLHSEKEKDPRRLRMAALALREARPTAVNLMHAMDRMLGALERGADLAAEAEAIFAEDVALCAAISSRAADFLADGDGVLTHCNTGGLATAGIGTALGAIRYAHEAGKKLHVYVDETRPLLQGARLTTWELEKLKIPFTLICDSMAGALLQKGKVQKVIVGADRIAANGDVANKIGTYGLAVLARHHGVPFYVAAPSTTLDPSCATGKEIPIEERDAAEVRAGLPVWNPAFDVTPRALIQAIVLEDRVL